MGSTTAAMERRRRRRATHQSVELDGEVEVGMEAAELDAARHQLHHSAVFSIVGAREVSRNDELAQLQQAH